MKMFRLDKKWMTKVSLIIIALAIYISVIYYLTVCDTIFNRLKAYVLTDLKYVNNAKIIEATEEFAGVDELDRLHIKIPIEQARELVTKNIMKDCEIFRSNCTKPIWIPYNQLPKWLISLYVDTNNQRNSLCTAAWNNEKDDIKSICIDASTGDFWYQLDIT